MMIKILIFLILLTILSIYISINVLQISHYNVKSNKIPDAFNNLKILQLSDLHSKSFGINNKYLLNKINAENPDIIVMTGDMVNTIDRNFKSFFDLASTLSTKYEIYYTFGNHEENLTNGRKSRLINSMKELGITIIYNEKILLTKNGESINLYGLQFNKKYYKKNNVFTVDENKYVLGNIDNDDYNILLAHNPLHFNTYSKWGADLVLSGHVHGGVIRIPFLGGIISPERNFFPRYCAGKYKLNDSNLIVNRGLGNTKLKLRLFNRPEICIIKLKKEEEI